MDSEYMTALIGVLGTLAGTILGWGLNSLSKIGKLNIYINNWQDSFTCTGKYGETVESHSIEQTEFYSFSLSLDVYNSSDDTQIMRDLIICFRSGKKELKNCVPNDTSTKRLSKPFVLYDKVSVINIPAKSALAINLNHGFSKTGEGIDFIWQTDNIILKYKDKHNREKRKTMQKKKYNLIFSEDRDSAA